MPRTRTRLLVPAVLGAVVLAGCGTATTTPPVDDPVLSSPHVAPTDDPAPAAPDPTTVAVAFDTFGGCDMGGSGCPPVRTVDAVSEIDASAAEVLAGADLERLAGFTGDPGTGCGGAFVDGVAVVARVSRGPADVTTDVDRVVFCLSDADEDLAAVAVLWELYEHPQAAEPAPVIVRYQTVGGCTVAEGLCPPPLVVDAAFLDHRAHAELLDADLDALTAVGAEPDTCGQAPVDGLGIIAELTFPRPGVQDDGASPQDSAAPDPDAPVPGTPASKAPAARLCLSDADQDLAGVRALWSLFELAGGPPAAG